MHQFMQHGSGLQHGEGGHSMLSKEMVNKETLDKTTGYCVCTFVCGQFANERSQKASNVVIAIRSAMELLSTQDRSWR